MKINKNSKLVIYLDLDGVHTNLIGGIENFLNVDLSGLNTYKLGKYLNMPDKEIWSAINSAGHNFWANLERYPWSEDLLKLSFRYGADVLISTSPSQDPYCASGKIEWIKKNFPSELHRKFFIGPCKERLATGKNTILIDDNDKKIERFKKAGGAGILFPQKWNSASEYTSNRLGYVEDRIREVLPKVHVLILEGDMRRMTSFQQRFDESSIANFTYDHVETVEQAKDSLSNKNYDLIFLGHDLGGEILVLTDLGGENFVLTDEKNTGSELSRWIASNDRLTIPNPILIHSYNPQGADYMHETFSSAGIKSHKVPGLWTREVFKNICF